MQLDTQLLEGSPTGVQVLDTQDYAPNAPVSEDTVKATPDAFEARGGGSGIEAPADEAQLRWLERWEAAGNGDLDEVRRATEGPSVGVA